MTWGKRKGKAARKIQGRGTEDGAIARNRNSRAMAHSRLFFTLCMAVMLSITTVTPPLPLANAASEPSGSTGFEGTTNYSDFFAIDNRCGTVGAISGNTLTAASTTNREHYDWSTINARWVSSAAFVSRKPISLEHDWRVNLTAEISNPQHISSTNYSRVWAAMILSNTNNASTATGPCINIAKRWSRGGEDSCAIHRQNWVNGAGSASLDITNVVPSDSYNIVVDYSSSANSLTFSADGKSVTWPNIRAVGDASPYLMLMGNISWEDYLDPGASNAHLPGSNMYTKLTFNSMSLPHLTPAISDISIYRYNAETDAYDIALSKDETVEPNAIVQVRCKVRNTNSQAGSEQFNMHLRLGRSGDERDGQSFATTGITPFFSRGTGQNYPLLIDGNATYVDENGATRNLTDLANSAFNEGGGVPLTLVGNAPVEVTYYAHVNQSVSESVMLGQALIEDTFQGTHYEKAELLSQKTLMPGDTDDPTLVPGTDYHYTRLPAANENGWNGKATSPVDVTFYAGDFDEFTVTRNADQSVLSTLAGGQKWTQAADVDSLPVTYQARNTSSGGTSSKGADVIRIDTHEPELSYDAATGTLTAGDAAPAGSGKATSGIWRIERVKADGRPLAAQDVTPRGDAVQALAVGTAAAPSASAGQASWVFPLADGKGQPAQSVPSAQPGFYAATDAAGNVSAVLEVKAATDPDEPGPDDPDPDNPGPGKPDNPGDNPNPSTPTFPTVTPKPGDGPDNPAPDPLKPTHVETDLSTGLSHATVQDAITIPTSPDKVTTAMMAQLIDKRYTVTSSLGDSRITAGPVRLLDAAGNPTDAIDRTRPGAWYAEQTFTDAAGNTTTIRLTITVRDSLIDGTIGTIDDGNGNSSANAGANGNGSGEGHRTALANRISRLPQTGGIFGPCPLHILFVLMTVMASAYSLARLRQNRISRDRKRQREEQSATARTGSRDGLTDGCTGQLSAGECERSGLSPFDALVYGFITLCALAVGFLALCPWDMLLAVLTVLACVLWAALLHHRRPAGDSREEPAFR